MTILDYFPSKYKPRESQVKILKDIDSAISSGFRKIILCAPTGIGKSHIAMTTARLFGKSFVITASKQLQDQYVHDFPFLYSVKGKSTFPCFDLMGQKQIKDHRLAMRQGLSCTVGICEKGTKEIIGDNGKPKQVPEYCDYRPNIKEFKVSSEGQETELVTCIKNDACLYYKQKFAAALASHSIFNYDSYFQAKKFKSVMTPYMERPLAIFDEAHEIEDRIIGFIGFDITRSHIADAGLNFVNYDVTEIDMVQTLLEDLVTSYTEISKKISSQTSTFARSDLDKISGQLAKVTGRLERFKNAQDEFITNKENFVINTVEKDVDGVSSVSVRPLDVSRYAEEFFNNECQLFMSATLSKQMLSDMTGFNKDDVAVIDVEKSPFPRESRRIDFLNTRYLSRNSTQDDRVAVIQEIDKIMQRHKNERGLILTSSKAACYEIKNLLSPQSKARITILHSGGDNNKTREEILQEHSFRGDSVLLSSSAWVGLDLKDDLSRFQIISKVPYPSLAERRIKLKMEKNHTWYSNMTLIKLLQGFGRSVRNETDYAKTYVLDGNAKVLLHRMKDHIPKSFHDVIFESQ